MEQPAEFNRFLKTSVLVGISILVSLVIYLALGEFIRSQFRPFRGFVSLEAVQTVRYAFFAGAIAAVVLIRILRPLLLKKGPEATGATAVLKLHRTSLFTLALSETPAVLGLVLFLLSGLNVDFYILLLVSFVLVFMYFPRRSHWEEWLRG